MKKSEKEHEENKEEEELISSTSEEEEDWTEQQGEDEDLVPESLDDLMHTLVRDERFLGEFAKRLGMSLPKEPLPTYSQYRTGMRVEARLASGNQWWPCKFVQTNHKFIQKIHY